MDVLPNPLISNNDQNLPPVELTNVSEDTQSGCFISGLHLLCLTVITNASLL